MEEEQKTTNLDIVYNPHILCELQGGHIWINILTKNDLDQDIKLTVCQQCKKVKSTFGE